MYLQQLSERLKGCEIWGDLKLSKDEYEELKISIAKEFVNFQTANTLKRLIKKNGEAYLKPENKEYKDIYPVNELIIQGVVTALIRKY